jgi:hypothetical protein
VRATPTAPSPGRGLAARRVVAVSERRAHAIHVPLEASEETVERLEHLQRMTCLDRAFVVIEGDAVFVHFRAPDDAAHFAQMFASFYDAVADEPEAVTPAEQCRGGS